MENAADLKAGFEAIERVVADPVRFKLRLGIGEEAYASLRLRKNLMLLWDAGSWGGTGAVIASSQAVATTFFAPTGFLALLGFGTAVTPMGWVVAAAVGSAGAYFGVTRLFGRFAGSRVETIPKFINTPIDMLGASLLDMMGALAVRLAAIDGQVDSCETDAIADYFVSEWGFDRPYVDRALEVLVANSGQAGLKELAGQLRTFQAENPDCNADAMRSEMLSFLREIAMADGVLDEREELALEAIERVVHVRLRNRVLQGVDRLATIAGSTAASLGSVGSRLPKRLAKMYRKRTET